MGAKSLAKDKAARRYADAIDCLYDYDCGLRDTTERQHKSIMCTIVDFIEDGEAKKMSENEMLSVIYRVASDYPRGWSVY